MIINTIEKLKLLSKVFHDLRDVNYSQLYDIAALTKIGEDPQNDEDVIISYKELLRLTINTREERFNNNDLYFFDLPTICKLVLEVQEKIEEIKADSLSRATDEVVIRLTEKGICDANTREALECKIAVLEETIHSLKLAKTIILPTENMYKSKQEFDALRKHLQEFIRISREEGLRYSNLQQENIRLHKQIDDMKKVMVENNIHYAEEYSEE